MGDDGYIFFVIFGAIFAIIGLVLAIVPIRSYLKKKKKYTIPVNATCTGYEKYKDSEEFDAEENELIPQNGEEININVIAEAEDMDIVRAIYKINYNGGEYEVKSRTFSNVPTAQIGSVRQIFIDPTNPKEFFDPKEEYVGIAEIAGGIIAAILGSVFVVVGLGLVG